MLPDVESWSLISCPFLSSCEYRVAWKAADSGQRSLPRGTRQALRGQKQRPAQGTTGVSDGNALCRCRLVVACLLLHDGLPLSCFHVSQTEHTKFERLLRRLLLWPLFDSLASPPLSRVRVQRCCVVRSSSSSIASNHTKFGALPQIGCVPTLGAPWF